jgi:hypothetical protein
VGSRGPSFIAVVAVALLALIASPGAFGAALTPSQPAAKVKSASVIKQVTKLKRKLKRLQRQLDGVAKQQGPQGPRGPEGPEGPQGPPGPSTGPAGGDLTGTYPSPLIAPDAVGGAEIQTAAVTETELATNAVNGDEILDDAVTVLDRANNSVDAGELQPESVSSDALDGMTPVVGEGVEVTAGTPQNAEVSCPIGQQVIGGGFGWHDDEANSVLTSAPSESAPNRTWIVRGMVAAGSNTLFAWANCLAP